MQVNPLELTRRIKEIFDLYLDTIYQTKYDYINKLLKEKKNEEREKFFKGPYIQASPNYKLGTSLKELSSSGVLHPETRRIIENGFERKGKKIDKIFKHQEKVIKKVLEGKNVLISTGTGSGKTLSFLIPVIDYIVRSGKRGKGIKAVFIYPMNALANDQVKELRNFLNKTDITFARYTGDTPHTKEEFNSKKNGSYEDLKQECQEELLTRDEILSNPPDILITNYSMLEYLLLRPKDTPLFEDKSWKFLILDEIHVYDGAKGAEIGYLMRRVKQRACSEPPICIGASATLGGKEEDRELTKQKAADFATAIFGEPFYKENVVEAEFEEISTENEILRKVRKSISVPKEISEVQKRFSNLLPSEEKLVAEIEKWHLEEDFKARYHFFVKAPDGVFVTLNKNGNVETLSFKRERTRNGKKVFQLTACRYCGEIFITGYLNKKNNKLELHFHDPVNLDKMERTFLAIPNEITRETLELMAENSKRRRKEKTEKYYLNIESGELTKEEKHGENWIEVFKLEREVNDIFFQPKKCPSCGVEGRKHKKGMWISYFTPPQEKPQAVLLEVLFRHIVENSEKQRDRKIIAFSDSRKDAAFFATAYQDFNNEIWEKWIFYRSLTDEPLNKESVKKRIIASLYQNRKWKDDRGITDKSFVREFALIYDSLERNGLVKFLLPEEKEEKIINQFKDIIPTLKENDIKGLLYNLLAGLRENRIVEDKGNELGYEWYLWPEKTSKIRARNAVWIPYRKKDGSISVNKRFHLLKRIFPKLTDFELLNLLEKIWKIIKSEVFSFYREKGYLLDPSLWKVQKNYEVYICNRCGKLHTWNVGNVCINTGCNGSLIKKSINDVPYSKFYLTFFSEEKGRLWI